MRQFLGLEMIRIQVNLRETKEKHLSAVDKLCKKVKIYLFVC